MPHSIITEKNNFVLVELKPSHLSKPIHEEPDWWRALGAKRTDEIMKNIRP